MRRAVFCYFTSRLAACSINRERRRNCRWSHVYRQRTKVWWISSLILLTSPLHVRRGTSGSCWSKCRSSTSNDSWGIRRQCYIIVYDVYLPPNIVLALPLFNNFSLLLLKTIRFLSPFFHLLSIRRGAGGDGDVAEVPARQYQLLVSEDKVLGERDQDPVQRVQGRVSVWNSQRGNVQADLLPVLPARRYVNDVDFDIDRL